MALCSQTLADTFDAHVAGIMAIYRGILFSQDCGLFPSVLESDMARAVASVLNDNLEYACYGHILSEITVMRSSANGLDIKAIQNGANFPSISITPHSYPSSAKSDRPSSRRFPVSSLTTTTQARKEYTSVMIVPTGVGATIGGFAGDALPVARALSSVVDCLITHPNVLNAAMLYWSMPNVLYVEGYVSTGRMVLDAGIEEELRIRHLQVADAARASLGLPVVEWNRYLAGVEAVISHLLVKEFQIPCAHAPAMLPLPLTQYLSPKSAAEEIGYTFLPCVLAGLSNAPQYLVKNSESLEKSCILASDVDSVILPIDACGGDGALAFATRKRNKPLIIAVEENETVLNDTPDKLGIEVIKVTNYWEAIGVIAAHKAGINPNSMRRNRINNLRCTSVTLAATPIT
ncbi:hypothetical protein LWI29_002349 [Acer saccharum]|uniref:DUF3326 domain-containing protein n=1 Tax=Acer saccharum TaxID=4024 RepID=A0AA39RGG3_ACESA|nr:hypothetical protein LWI29_002349 [Acer saccharum]